MERATKTPLPGGEGLGEGLLSSPWNIRKFVAFEPASPSLSVACQGQFLGNGLNNAVGIGKNIDVPEADKTIPVKLDDARSHGVIVAGGVLTAVNFDHEFRRPAYEVGDIALDRVLPGEMKTQLIAFKPRPKSFFGIRRVRSQLAGSPCHAFCRHCCYTPSGSYTPSQPSPSRGRAFMPAPARGRALYGRLI